MTATSDVSEFARGGLARRCAELDVRVLLQPADPTANQIRIDEALRAWMEEVRTGEFLDPWMRLIPTSHHLVGASWWSDDESWTQYLGIGRSGFIDSGRRAGHITSGARYLPLRAAVRVVADAVALGAAAADRWNIVGPWEVSVALIDVGDAVLSGFARGHNDTHGLLRQASICHEAAVLHTWEVDELDRRAIAVEAGDRVENSFGSVGRRHLTSGGEDDGELELYR